ncbi:flagellar biosynthesis protein FlgD [Motiliproteus coralliicola]|uniref:Basal-body rod modification protein FlgD n=1 Tax=Motiliproteus coralliicola TaxID=2283196 RepID=A0A369WK19_9GAMM|nr:flagellar hook capping FlgD N-terminal domain-containing protein [Motiliproteus coralliicola]RDE22388.1 flagellar biosynthesis protein FlgD [Motiliproteus coralliicola]
MSNINNVNSSGNVFLDLNKQDDASKTAAQEQSDMFMQLMIAQMQNQDPTSPADTSDYMNQISQMSMVESINNMNLTMQGMSNSMLSSQTALQASSMVGKTVYVPTTQAKVGDDGMIQGVMALQTSHEDVRVKVYDSTGAQISNLSLGAQAAGDGQFKFQLPEGYGAGDYKIEVEAKWGDDYVPVQAYLGRNVDSVSLGQNGVGMKINIEGGSVSFDQVKQIGA